MSSRPLREDISHWFNLIGRQGIIEIIDDGSQKRSLFGRRVKPEDFGFAL